MFKATFANIVLIPSQPVNAAVFNQLWLVEHGIFEKGELEAPANNIFLPVFVNVQTSVMDVLIMGERIQFTSKFGAGRAAEFHSRFSKFLTAAGIAVGSIGFNWHFQLMADEEPDVFAERVNTLLLAHENPLAKSFRGKDACLGATFSRSYDDGKLQIDARQSEPGAENGAFLACNVNFHFPVSGLDGALKKVEMAESYHEVAKEHAKQLHDALTA